MKKVCWSPLISSLRFVVCLRPLKGFATPIRRWQKQMQARQQRRLQSMAPVSWKMRHGLRWRKRLSWATLKRV